MAVIGGGIAGNTTNGTVISHFHLGGSRIATGDYDKAALFGNSFVGGNTDGRVDINGGNVGNVANTSTTGGNQNIPYGRYIGSGKFI